MMRAVATAQERFGDLAGEHVAPWLAERDFRRNGATWRRRAPQAWQIVNLQKSQYSTRRTVSFTVNLGIAFDVVNPAPAWGKRGWPREYECDLRRRLGLLIDDSDRWWNVRAMMPTGRVARDVIALLGEHGLPWLEALSDPNRAVMSTAPEDQHCVRRLERELHTGS